MRDLMKCVCTYVCTCHACWLRNSECHVSVRMALSWPSEHVARSRSALPRGSRTAPGRAKGLENGTGPSGGGGGERGVFKHRGQSQARWAVRAWGSGGDGMHTQRAVRERGRRTCPPGNDRSKIHA